MADPLTDLQPPPPGDQPIVRDDSRRRFAAVRRLLGAGGRLIRDRRRLVRLALASAVLLVAAWMLVPRLVGSYHLHAGRAALAQDHCRTGLDHVLAALSVWPGDHDVQLLAARAARRSGELEAADYFLNQCGAAPALADDVMLERVMLRAQRGELDEVADFCHALVTQDHPATPLILEALILGYTGALRLPEALYFIETWLTRTPDHPQALYLKGNVELRAAHQQDAIVLFERVLELDSARDDARLLLAAMHLDLGQAQEALPHLERLQRTLPGNIPALIRLARCYDMLGRPEDAQRILDDVLAREPREPEALATRGKLARRVGDLETAEKYLREAGEIDGGSSEVQYQLMQCYRALGKTADAEAARAKKDRIEQDNKRLREIATQALSARPRDPALHVEIAEIMLRFGQPQHAEHWLKRALQIDPHYAGAHSLLARYYRSIGQLAKADRHRALGSASGSGQP